jgi:uncharacterized membrane protein YgdD (TMEM256/DUF423 family)
MTLPRAARLWMGLGGLAGALGVAGSAAAAHGASLDPPLLETAARMQLIHAPALLGVAWLTDRLGGAWPALAGLGFLLGMLLFCGTLGARAFGYLAQPPGLAPAGGMAFMAGWLLLAISALAAGGSGRG